MKILKAKTRKRVELVLPSREGTALAIAGEIPTFDGKGYYKVVSAELTTVRGTEMVKVIATRTVINFRRVFTVADHIGDQAVEALQNFVAEAKAAKRAVMAARQAIVVAAKKAAHVLKEVLGVSVVKMDVFGNLKTMAGAIADIFGICSWYGHRLAGRIRALQGDVTKAVEGAKALESSLNSSHWVVIA